MNKNRILLIVIFVALVLITCVSIIAAEETEAYNPKENTLDKILNFVIPLVCFGLFGMLLYKAFKEPLDKFFYWIKEKMAPSEQPQQSMYQKYRNAYMIPGDIKYQ